MMGRVLFCLISSIVFLINSAFSYDDTFVSPKKTADILKNGTLQFSGYIDGFGFQSYFERYGRLYVCSLDDAENNIVCYEIDKLTLNGTKVQ